ncbi:hypothetical protein EC973_008312 [Apophysomyces ossiformis]|uniref:Tyrosine specific protein phosphatases domain-containing protein n=1 Tax=Apophysomyces ossiformis TaxID=679940 RepID=A0A8H7BZ48_9FUNG|nr:hypothetical protein EC973_008312 [Apophysomyces ossiformis]
MSTSSPETPPKLAILTQQNSSLGISQALYAEGNDTDADVNLCAEFPGYLQLYQDLAINQVRLPTTDFTIPSLDTIDHAVKEIMHRHDQGSIYLHCKAGRGRSAIVALCYLLRTYKLNPQQAQQILLEHRPQVDKELFQTEEVRMFYKGLIADAESGKITRIPYS